MKATDAELLLLFVQHRSEPAFRAIVERHQDLVFGICCRKLGDRHLAEDATQQVFATLACKAAKLDRGPLAGYLTKMTIYHCANLGRSRTTRRRHERGYQSAFEWGAREPDERLTKLQEVLAQMRGAYREAVTLRYVDGLSIESIGLALELSPHAVKKRLVRGLAHLRERMAAHGFGISLAVLLGQLKGPPAPVGLAARIVDSVFSSPGSPVPHRLSLPSHQLVIKAGLGIGAVMTVATVATLAFQPRARSMPAGTVAPSAPTPLLGAGGTARDETISFNRRLGRKLAGWSNQRAPFDFILSTLSEMSDVRIEPRWDAIEAAGIPRHKELIFDLHDKTLLEDLDAILGSAASGKLEYVVLKDRIIIQPRQVPADSHQTAAAVG